MITAFATSRTWVRVSPRSSCVFIFFFNDTATTEIYTLSLHDALPILCGPPPRWRPLCRRPDARACSTIGSPRSEEHTSELQSRSDLVCRLLLEKKNDNGQHSRYCTMFPRSYF